MRSTRIVLLLVVLTGLALRLTYIATTGQSSFTQSRTGEIAHNIVDHGRWFVYNEHARLALDRVTGELHRNVDPREIDFAVLDRNAPFYPEIGESVGSSAVLAGVWQLFGDGRYLPLQVLQALLDALAALLVYRIAMRLFAIPRAALLAATLYALYPPIAWLTVAPSNDIWAVDATIAIVALYVEALHSPHRWRWLIACGAVAGVGSYFRPNVLVVAPMLALATIALAGWREALRRGLAVTTVAALLVIPWTVRNYEDFHAFIPGTASVWENMWNGLGELPNGFGASNGTHGVYELVRRARPDLRPESPAWDSYLKGWVVHAIEHRPLFYLEGVAHRAALASVWNHDQTWMRRGVAPLLSYRGGIFAFVVERPLDLLEYALAPLAFLLAMCTLVLTRRRFRRQHLVLIAAALGVLLPYVLIHMEGRYVLPAEFAYLIWLGLGAHLLLERLGARTRARAFGMSRRVTTPDRRRLPTPGDASPL